MIENSNNPTENSENSIPAALDMWKMFHNTVTGLFKNLDSAEHNFQALANTILSSKEFSDIFIPRYDYSTLTYEQTQTLEDKYQGFTSWLLGRLFYLLSYEKYERIHELFVQAQLKILIVLRVNQPHVYNKMIDEYNKALTITNSYLEELTERNEGEIIINNFVVNDNISQSIELDLSPSFVQIRTEKSALLLQHNLGAILTETSLIYVETFYLINPTRSIFRNIEYCLRNSLGATKAIIVRYFTKLIGQSFQQIRESPHLTKHYQEIFGYLEQIIIYGKYDEGGFEEALSELFDRVRQVNAVSWDRYTRDKCRRICEIILTRKLSTVDGHVNVGFIRSTSELFIIVLEKTGELYPNPEYLIAIVKSQVSQVNVDILLRFQIFGEFKKYIKEHGGNGKIDALVVSKTWRTIYGIICGELDECIAERKSNQLVLKMLCLLKNVMKMAQNIYYMIQTDVTFFAIQEILYKLKKIITIYKINTSNDSQSCLDAIVTTLSSIILFTNPQKYQEFKCMVEMICYPFSNQLNLSSVKHLINNECNINEQQIKSIEILSVCLVNANETQQKQHLQLVLKWILDILKYSAAQEHLQKHVAQHFLNFISTCKTTSSTDQLYEIFRQLMFTKNLDVLPVLSKHLGKIICVFSGKGGYVTKLQNNQLFVDVLCVECDKTQSESVNMKTTKANFSIILNIFSTDLNEVKMNLIEQLPRFVQHLPSFNHIEMTKKWLKYLVDDNGKVREHFTRIIQKVIETCQNNESIKQDYKDLMLNACLQALIDATQKYLCYGPQDLLATILDTIKEVGCLSSYPIVVRKTTKLIIFYLILSTSQLYLTAIDYLNRISKAHQHQTPNMIFTKFKKDFCQSIANLSGYAFITKGFNIIQSLDRIALAFDFRLKEFMTRNSHHLIPFFIPLFLKVPQSRTILTDIASLMQVQPHELLLSNFSYIYSYIYLNETPEIFQQSMSFVEQETRANINELKRRNIKVIHNELLLHVHDKSELVIKELYKLSQEVQDDSSSSSSKSKKSQQQISDYLQPRFLGVLVYFDSKLISSSVDESVKIRVLESLPKIMELMGSKYITPLRHKVLATLRTALSLTDKTHLELTCNNWQAFVHCCDVDTLGPLLSTIFVSILPLLAVFPRKVNAIYRYLIIENNDKLKEYIEDLYFLIDSSKVDSDLKNVIRGCMRNQSSSSTSRSFKDHLVMYLKYINHENMEVRVYGLKALKKFLETRNIELEQLITGNNGMDPIFVNIIDVLIAGCRVNDIHVQLACGECIGELGAIEPSHFPRKYTQAQANFTFFITDDSFVINTLTEIVRFFQIEKHSQNMNRYALAIQEILKSYGVSPDKNAAKSNIWSAFPENMQEIMLPLLSSKYTVGNPYMENITAHPIYGSHMGSTFNDWVYNWTCRLISFWKNDKRALLQVCKPSLKYDFRALMIFLPHILIHALLECSNDERRQIFDEFMAVLCLTASNSASPENRKYFVKTVLYKGNSGDDGNKNKNDFIKVVFVLLDFMDRWLREYEFVKCPKSSDSNYRVIGAFVAQFCKLQIARCNFERGEYPRALLYLEQYAARDRQKIKDNLGLFARIYAELEEPDGVAGAMAMQETEPSLEHMILAHNVSGQLQDAAACYERMAQEHKLQPEYLQDMVRCYLELDNPFTALNFVNGAMEKMYSEHKSLLYESQAEPFWRLNMYDELEELLTKPEMRNNLSWGVRMGQLLLYFRKGERLMFQNELTNIRKILIEKLSITSLEEGVYAHGYPHIIKLHILNEMEKAEQIIYNYESESNINNLIDEWNIRLNVVQSSVRYVEPILRLRRIILEQFQLKRPQTQTNLNKHIAKYWLKSAEIARKANMFQQAYIYILKAEQYKPMELFIEKAKLYWAKEEQEHAFNTLKRGIEEHFHDASTFKDMDMLSRKGERKLCAEAKLLIATYNDETSNVDMDVNITNYREAVEMYREWEKSQVCLAQYYDRVFSTMNDDDKDTKGADIQIHIINCFGKSLQYGSSYIYQSMPRMLSIWFDYGTRIVQSRQSDTPDVRESKKQTLLKMIKLMDTYLDRLPAYMFLSAFSQLVSRICHPVREVYIEIKSILIKLIVKYPQQSMWMIMAVSKSAYAMRTKRCQEVLQDQRLRNINKQVLKLICDFNRLAEKLIELCNKPIGDGVQTASVNSMIRTLPRLLQNKDFSEIMLPVQRLSKLVLPPKNYNDNSSQYNPFPNTCIHICGIEDEVVILQSLQRPRRITFRGSDGNKYIFMLKPKDDLRKDCRLMEFNDVVNLYLVREAESRQRRLCIRTYAVVPLNEECGIVEWIDNLVGLRPILMRIYKQRGLYLGARDLKAMMCTVRDPLAKKRQVFERQLLPRHPPVLGEWFRRMFPDSHSWYHARTAYVRTSAVVSMVGYVLGLGDRHGENILFDATNGDTVHVDFNCLFNKGETFDWPERVPFRLTHNMVDAMGPLGVEGIFRRTCAVTLRVLRTHTDTLMSIVRPFVYDPLVSWPRNQMNATDAAAADTEAERTNEKALEHIRNIELRLQGMIKTRGKSFSISLSCEGQANNLILEATSIDNLSQMYIGWGPFL